MDPLVIISTTVGPAVKLAFSSQVFTRAARISVVRRAGGSPVKPEKGVSVKRALQGSGFGPCLLLEAS